MLGDATWGQAWEQTGILSPRRKIGQWEESIFSNDLLQTEQEASESEDLPL